MSQYPRPKVAWEPVRGENKILINGGEEAGLKGSTAIGYCEVS